MSQLFFLFWSAFAVALSGALMPGPVLTATISEVMKRGFKAGPLIVAGHAILEICLLVTVVAGLGPWITRNATMGVLGIGGGGLLVLMGIQMAVTARKTADLAVTTKADPQTAIRGPVLTGILTSLSNPFWAIWWTTIGLNYRPSKNFVLRPEARYDWYTGTTNVANQQPFGGGNATAQWLFSVDLIMTF